MKALITGGRGFIGRHMRKTLTELNYDVDTIDIKIGEDVYKWIPTCIRRYDLVVHAAAKGPHRKAIDTERANFPYNTGLDAVMFEWAIRTKQRRFVYLSSSAIYTPNILPHKEHAACLMTPHDTYGLTKVHGELMANEARAEGIEVTVVRPFSGYGEDQSLDFPFRAFAERAKRKENPFTIWGSADQVRDWVHVDDICNAIMALVAAGLPDPVNICTGIGTSMRDLAYMMVREVGYHPDIFVDTKAPLGVHTRVGNPVHLWRYYTPKISIEEGVRRVIHGTR